MHLFTAEHSKLVNACYPDTATPDYRPNAQELSRLTYYASNKPEKITKIGGDLQKRVGVDTRKAQAGNVKYRASLLTTLAIFRALATECRRDLPLLSSSLIASVDTTLSALPKDLEVTARVAAVFTAWTTYTDGHLIGVDSSVTQGYSNILNKFAALSSMESADHEIRNRNRLVGLASLMAAVTSEALYSSPNHFRAQVTTIMRPLLVVLLQSELSLLNEQAATVKEDMTSPYLSEFRTRPAMERRAASIHLHVDGERGPGAEDVCNASLHILHSLLEHSNGGQLGHIMVALFNCLDELDGWKKQVHCCWLAQKTSEWSQYQYRYAVPTWLVERMLENKDVPTATTQHTTLVAMVTTVFRAPTPLVNLSTSDIISNLITLLLRRVAVDPEDALLPALVECISSLGTHVYYADQIHDLAGELISRLVVVEAHGVPGVVKADSKKSRSQAIRCLLAGLLGLIQAAGKEESVTTAGTTSPGLPEGSGSRSGRRARVSPDVWKDTLTLLCDGDFSVRADYADALVLYLRTEIPKQGDCTDSDGIKRVRPLDAGPAQTAQNMNSLIHGDSITRTLNSIHGYLYILATTSSLGNVMSASATASPSPARSVDNLHIDIPQVNILPATPQTEPGSSDQLGEELPKKESPAASTHTTAHVPKHRSSLPRSRKASTMQRLLQNVPTRISGAASASASDYVHVLVTMSAVHEEIPARGLLTGVPMMLALTSCTMESDIMDFATAQRVQTIKEVIARVWQVIARVWGCSDLHAIVDQALLSLPAAPTALPKANENDAGVYHPPKDAIDFPAATPPPAPWAGVDTEKALLCLVSSLQVQEATGLDQNGLLRRFAIHWTADGALNDSLERPLHAQDSLGNRTDGSSPLLKISPALMQAENMSMQSLARSIRGPGVSELREALEGRSSMSNPALAGKATSFSTLDNSFVGELAPSRLVPTKSRKRAVTNGPNEVRDVLQKLGIGKSSNNGSLLKSSFPALKKSDSRLASAPYKT